MCGDIGRPHADIQRKGRHIHQDMYTARYSLLRNRQKTGEKPHHIGSYTCVAYILSIDMIDMSVFTYDKLTLNVHIVRY